MVISNYTPDFTSEHKNLSIWQNAINDCLYNYMNQYNKYTDEEYFYGLVNSDDTLNFGYQNKEFIFIIHINGFSNYKNNVGFGCIINKFTNEIHLVKLQESNGFFMAGCDMNENKLTGWEWMYISSIVNNMETNLFKNKSQLIQKIFNNGIRS